MSTGRDPKTIDSWIPPLQLGASWILQKVSRLLLWSPYAIWSLWSKIYERSHGDTKIWEQLRSLPSLVNMLNVVAVGQAVRAYVLQTSARKGPSRLSRSFKVIAIHSNVGLSPTIL